ncbi:MAG: rhodanese-like domain-containing protein [Aliarcobacter sp.]|nr:rhodanese-like domain-containing protein [Aliarcobacter sp.]
MKNLRNLVVSTLILAFSSSISLGAEVAESFVAISSGVKSIDMNLNGEKFTLMRNQTAGNKITPLYDTTDRGTPQPMILAPGVETVGELEFIDYMKKAQTDENIVIIDSRKPGWFARLRIPGAVNVPYTNFDNMNDAIDMMEDNMGITVKADKTLDFSKAKTLVLYCNGYWCGQTPGMVKNAQFALLKIGYPADKIKYYRGGMQAWTSLGFTVVGDDAK